MIKVAIALPNYIDGKLGGTQTFVDSLIPRLGHEPELAVEILLPRGQDSGQFSGCTINEYFLPAVNIVGPLPAILQTATSGFRDYLENFDVVFFPLQSSLRTRKINIPSLVTVHDVQHLDLPELFSKMEKLYRRFFYDRQAACFTHIVTDSDFSKNRIVNRLGIFADNVSVQHIGTESIAPSPRSLQEDFFIYPARGWKHKNHNRLFEAMRIAIAKGSNLDLVLTGEPPEIPEDLKPRVKNLGRVSRDELSRLYRTATGMIFPSLYEGFGLPPIEAMSAGCLTYVSNVGSLPEVCGNASYYFDPMDVDAISEAILAMESPNPDLVNKGIIRASQFNWEKTAQGYLHLFRKLAKSQS